MPPSPAEIRKAVFRVTLRHAGRETEVELIDDERHLRRMPARHISALERNQKITQVVQLSYFITEPRAEREAETPRKFFAQG